LSRRRTCLTREWRTVDLNKDDPYLLVIDIWSLFIIDDYVVEGIR
jgi:hypothetical protein